MNSIALTYPLLNKPSKIVITTHQKPDGDAMGSSLGLYHFLIQLGHDVQVISPTNWPKFLGWMPGVDKVWDYEKKTENANQLIANADLIYCLDFNVLSRTKNMEQPLGASKAIRILIDHHEQPDTEKFVYGESLPHKSSTCEMVYDYIIAGNYEDKIDSSVAECLYTGVLTDTGSFRFPATDAGVHSMVSNLMTKGLVHTTVHENLFDNGTESRLKFIGNALANRMEVFYEYNTAIIAIPMSDLVKYNITTGETEGLVNYPLGIEGIRFAALVIDRGDLRKWSFRSKGDIDVNEFARTYFAGSGHKNASVVHSAATSEENVKQFKHSLTLNKDIISTYQF